MMVGLSRHCLAKYTCLENQIPIQHSQEQRKQVQADQTSEISKAGNQTCGSVIPRIASLHSNSSSSSGIETALETCVRSTFSSYGFSILLVGVDSFCTLREWGA